MKFPVASLFWMGTMFGAGWSKRLNLDLKLRHIAKFSRILTESCFSIFQCILTLDKKKKKTFNPKCDILIYYIAHLSKMNKACNIGCVSRLT